MRGIIPFVFLICIACGGQQRQRVITYYNIDSLVSSQQDLLVARHPLLNKKAYIDSDSSITDFKPGREQWTNELDIFKKIDINSPKLVGLYTTSTADDTHSNLKVRTLTTNDEDAEVKYLKLYYLDRLEKLKKIEALYIERNPIYASSREVTMVFDDFEGQGILKRYQVRGMQKTVLQDTVRFEISGQLNFH